MTDPTNPGVPQQPAPPLFPTTPPTQQWAPPPAGAPQPTAVGAWEPPPPGGELPVPAPTGGGRGGKGKLVIGVLALAVLGGGAYASAQLLGSDDRGAGSPEEAAEQLIAALNGSDVLGVIDLLPDGERDVLLSVTDLTEDARRLELLDDEDFSLDAFSGVSFEVTDAEFEVEELSDSDAGSLTRVSLVAGEATAELDGEAFAANVGDLGDELAESNGAELEPDDESESVDIADELERLEEEAEELDEEFINPFSIAVIEEDGRFFPSIGFTIAEFVRADLNRFGEELEAPDLDDGIEPEGGESPLEAVQALVDAATSLDGEAAIAALDPGEMGALQVYSPILGDFPDGEDSGVEIEIQDARVEDIGRGGSRVVPTALTASGEVDDVTFDFALEDSCVELSVEVDGEDEFELDRTCFDEDIDSDIADDVDVPQEISELIAAVSPIEGGIVTVERDGRHFVSPIRTVVQGVEGVVDDIDLEDVQEGGIIRELFAGDLGDEFEDFADSFTEATEDAEPEDVAVAVLALLQDQEVDLEELVFSSPTFATGVGFGIGFAVASSFEESFEEIEDFEDFEDFEDEFEDDEFEDDPPTTGPDEPVDRTPTGPTGTGPDGALLVGDVVSGSVAEDAVATFTAIGVADGTLIGAQATDGSDLTITVIDAATGIEIEFDDDFNAPDPEVLAFLEEGQVVTIEVRGFGGQPGEFVLYYEVF